MSSFQQRVHFNRKNRTRLICLFVYMPTMLLSKLLLYSEASVCVCLSVCPKNEKKITN